MHLTPTYGNIRSETIKHTHIPMLGVVCCSIETKPTDAVNQAAWTRSQTATIVSI